MFKIITFFGILFMNFSLISEDLFKVEGVIKMPPPYYKGKGIYENIGILSISPIDGKKRLASCTGIITKEDLMVDKGKIEKEAKENKGLIKSLKASEDLETSRFLAIMDKNGKIILASKEIKWEEMPEIPYLRSAYPLVMDETEKCPYALFYSGKLKCFDYSLNYKKSIDIPIENIDDIKVTFDGEIHTLWIFGKVYEKGKKYESMFDYFKYKPEKPMKLGIRFILEKEEVQDLPFTFEELYNEIERIAKDYDGKRIKIDPSNIYIESISYMENKDEFCLWVQGSDIENIENVFQYSGTMSFFKVCINPFGIGKVSQLPFWIKRAKIEKEKIDFENSILYLPELIRKGKKKSAYSFGGKEILFYFREAVAFPDERGKYNTSDMPILSYFVYFPSEKSKPEIYNFFEEIWPQMEKESEKSAFFAEPMFGIFSRIGKYDFLFKGACVEKEEKYSCFINAKFNK